MKNNLKAIRERLGMSQSALADALGLSQGNISFCETQRQEVSPELARNIVRLARERGLKVSFDDIYNVPDQAKAA